jgi:hypothetical protein
MKNGLELHCLKKDKASKRVRLHFHLDGCVLNLKFTNNLHLLNYLKLIPAIFEADRSTA